MSTPPPGWDAFATPEERKAGLSPAMAKALLAMNPSLREQGLCEQQLVAASRAPATVAPAKGDGISLFDLLDDESAKLAEARRAADEAIARLKAERESARAAGLAAVHRWLAKRDPDLLSPLTQRVLQQQRDKLAALGFSIDGYLDARRKATRI